jgi:hypothetical protein
LLSRAKIALRDSGTAWRYGIFTNLFNLITAGNVMRPRA